MFKQSLLVLTFLVPFSSHAITIWEASNLIESAINDSREASDFFDPIKQFITEKINQPEEIANLETILKNAEQTIHAQHKSCVSDNCLTVLDGANSFIGICAGLVGFVGAEWGSIFFVKKTGELWIDHLKLLSTDDKTLETTGASNLKEQTADIDSLRTDISDIKKLAITAVIGATIAIVNYGIHTKIQNILKKRDQRKDKLAALRELMEYIRYQQGIIAGKAIQTAE